jgi:GDPmannose 4,6-dehydratase
MRALITGIGGQDGCYLADLLLRRGYEVHGTTRRRPGDCFRPAELHVAHLPPLGERVRLHQNAADADVPALCRLLELAQPDELYNLAAESFVPAGDADPVSVGESAGLSAVRWLEAVRTVNPRIRMLQAGSSAMFGGEPAGQAADERTPICPRQPYGIAKAYAHFMLGYYRRQHGLFASSAILFNHESPLRSTAFVTRKITAAAAKIARGERLRLPLGNLDARRDWGFAGDYVLAMWQMLQQPVANDFVIASGRAHSVREFAEIAFARVGLDWQNHVDVEPALLRAGEARGACGDAAKARRVLAWKPEVSLPDLVTMMVDADVERAGGSGSAPV